MIGAFHGLWFVFSGYYISYDHAPAYWKGAYLTNPFYRVLGAIARINLEGYGGNECTEPAAMANRTALTEYATCLRDHDGSTLLESVGFEDVDAATNCGSLFAMWCASLALSLFFLHAEAGHLTCRNERTPRGPAKTDPMALHRAASQLHDEYVATIKAHIATQATKGHTEMSSGMRELAHLLRSVTQSDDVFVPDDAQVLSHAAPSTRPPRTERTVRNTAPCPPVPRPFGSVRLKDSMKLAWGEGKQGRGGSEQTAPLGSERQTPLSSERPPLSPRSDMPPSLRTGCKRASTIARHLRANLSSSASQPLAQSRTSRFVLARRLRSEKEADLRSDFVDSHKLTKQQQLLGAEAPADCHHRSAHEMSTLDEVTERGWPSTPPAGASDRWAPSDKVSGDGSPAAARVGIDESPRPRLGEGSMGRPNRASLKSGDSSRSERSGTGSGRLVTFGAAPAPRAAENVESHV